MDLVEERMRRGISDAFTRFAPRQLIERLAEDPSALEFGSEERDVSVIFGDLSGFTALSTRVGPVDLVRLVNEHLVVIADAVDGTGGYVDTFIGDAVMGLWGPPPADERHALSAVRAAMLAVSAVARASASAPKGARLSVKIGINPGTAVVGLVGTERRYSHAGAAGAGQATRGGAGALPGHAFRRGRGTLGETRGRGAPRVRWSASGAPRQPTGCHGPARARASRRPARVRARRSP